MLRAILAACRRRPYDDLLIACFPKSGSTYLSKLLQAATGFPGAYVAEFGPQREQDLVKRRLRRVPRRSVIQQHCKGTRTNVEMLLHFGIRPVVLTRSLFDTIVSLHDHYEREPATLPCGVFPANYRRLALAERLDFLISAHLPWYMNFYLSWLHASEHVEILPLSYESLFADVPGTLSDILRFYGLASAPERIRSAIERTAGSSTRLNVGVSGRGLELLLPRHRQAIEQLAAACHLELDGQGALGPRFSAAGASTTMTSRAA